ncbi:MAG: metal ABC transporter ATP-binding protein [Nitrososphaeraceae archaeon]|nr:metal ABC transporter ATP-binding protein [Nitrososphaeraceae archaeon]MDW0281655.1 metal ABC transporter ATP-binding protein [Nitrososphaeraceae archaeon]MDW0328929.1 metal ABC transporter ATP-binding protein [Nitrososphaeraceae archaeon]MDW0332112.1 metal ABC transporter ATP-binding protein [Nitrososphaeraceae archaeon]
MQEVIKLENVTYRYNSDLVLEDISFKADEADLLGIIGPNGAGKTTLFSLILGLLEGYQGKITVFGEDIRNNRKVLKKIGYIPQKNIIDKGFPATVEEIVSLGVFERKTKDKIISAIKTVGLLEQKHKRIGELSGGQQQRILIAKALVNEPQLLILDEPTTGIDLETQNKFYALLRKLNSENKITIILASHDLDAINKLANKIACVNRKMSFHGDAREFFGNEQLLKSYSESSMQAHMHLHKL